MWIYEKKLQYPVNIQKPDPAMAKLIITQLGGSDGEKGASDRYLNQRYAMPYPEIRALLTDIGTEEMAHEEMIATMVYQLLKMCIRDRNPFFTLPYFIRRIGAVRCVADT